DLAARVIVIAAGVIVAEGPPESIGGRASAKARIRFLLPAGADAAQLPIADAGGRDGEVVIETTEPTRELHRLTGWALERGYELAGLTVTRPSLEDVYLELTGPGSDETGPA